MDGRAGEQMEGAVTGLVRSRPWSYDSRSTTLPLPPGTWVKETVRNMFASQEMRVELEVGPDHAGL